MLEFLIGVIGVIGVVSLVILLGLALVGSGIVARVFIAPEQVSNDREYWE